MITRRSTLLGLAASTILQISTARADESATPLLVIEDQNYPPFQNIDPIKQFGNAEPDEAAKTQAKAAIAGAPKGPRPIDVANYFIDTYSNSEPELISQWPKAAAWNPLVVEFFRSTNYKADNDMIPWCAAFINWCLLRTNRIGSGSAASQSFLDKKSFEFISNPKVGDLAVFSCYDQSTGNPVGLGHVAFVAAKPTATHVLVAGGNQASGSRSMICRKPYPLDTIVTSRTISGVRTPVQFRFNTYISMG